jgi:hypothetical protein
MPECMCRTLPNSVQHFDLYLTSKCLSVLAKQCAVVYVLQVYIGSFNSDAPINTDKNPHCKELFLAEQQQLLADLYEIPHRSCDRKVSCSCRGRGPWNVAAQCSIGALHTWKVQALCP